MFTRKRLAEFTPDDRLFFNVHLDGLEASHDRAVERKGVFREAIAGIREAKAAGFKVSTNTTVYKETDMREIAELFRLSEAVRGGRPHDRTGVRLLRRERPRDFHDPRRRRGEISANIDALARDFPLITSPVYLEFLQGRRDLPCTAWGNPTYNVKRVERALLPDHRRSLPDICGVMTRTDWESYGRHGDDPRCEHCMVHCGYEPSAALGINAKLADSLKLLAWALR